MAMQQQAASARIMSVWAPVELPSGVRTRIGGRRMRTVGFGVEDAEPEPGLETADRGDGVNTNEERGLGDGASNGGQATAAAPSDECSDQPTAPGTPGEAPVESDETEVACCAGIAAASASTLGAPSSDSGEECNTSQPPADEVRASGSPSPGLVAGVESCVIGAAASMCGTNVACVGLVSAVWKTTAGCFTVPGSESMRIALGRRLLLAGSPTAGSCTTRVVRRAR